MNGCAGECGYMGTPEQLIAAERELAGFHRELVLWLVLCARPLNSSVMAAPLKQRHGVDARRESKAKCRRLV